MRKITMLIVILAALMMLIAVVPVFAVPAQKVSFVAIQITNVPPPPQGPDYRLFVTEGGTVHVQNQLGDGKLWISPNAPPSEPTGTTSASFSYNINSKTGQGDIKFEMVWTIGAGTYEGNIVGKMVTTPPGIPTSVYSLYLHGVLHGTGVYEGQTILLEGTRPAGQPFQWTGTIIIP